MIAFLSVGNHSLWAIACEMVIVEHDVYLEAKSRIQVVRMSMSVRVAVELYKLY